MSGKGRAYLPTRGKLRLHIDADFFKVAGDANHTRTACGAAPVGNTTAETAAQAETACEWKTEQACGRVGGDGSGVARLQ